MKTLLKIALYFCCTFVVNSTMGQEQLDSLFFIVDKDADYIHFTKGPGAKDFKIIVDCDYRKSSVNEEYITLGFHYLEYGKNYKKIRGHRESSNYIFKMCKKKLNEYQIIDTEWIHKQKTEQDIYRKLPYDWCFKNKMNFVIFKEDLLSNKNHIKAYGVACLDGYTIFQEHPVRSKKRVE